MRAIRLIVLSVLVAGLVVTPLGADAQVGGVSISTPYPAVAVEPGDTTTFDLEVSAVSEQRVDLEVTQVPRGWSATLRGGGFIIDGVYTDRRDPPDVQLEVEVPPSASPGTHRVVVVAQGPSGSDSLTLDLSVARAASGNVRLEPEFPSLRGAADTTFTFNVDLVNNTPSETDFTLQAVGPRGWKVEAKPSGEAQAATLNVAGGSTSSFTVEVDPPDNEVAGTYPIGVRVTGGGKRATTELQVEITGTTQFTLTTPDERLNADVGAGRTSEVDLVIVNEGTSPLLGVELSASPPSDWEVEFEPEIVESVPPGEVARVTALITPSGDAIAGDYVVSIDATAEEATETIDLRTTVKTSSLWGAVGILLIVGTLVGLGWVFRRYGRR